MLRSGQGSQHKTTALALQRQRQTRRALKAVRQVMVPTEPTGHAGEDEQAQERAETQVGRVQSNSVLLVLRRHAPCDHRVSPPRDGWRDKGEQARAARQLQEGICGSREVLALVRKLPQDISLDRKRGRKG